MKSVPKHLFSRKRVKHISYYSLIAIALVIGACTTQYYGHTQEEWEGMTPFEQEKAKAEWRQVIAAKEKGALGDPRAEISEGFIDHSRGTEENANDSRE